MTLSLKWNVNENFPRKKEIIWKWKIVWMFVELWALEALPSPCGYLIAFRFIHQNVRSKCSQYYIRCIYPLSLWSLTWWKYLCECRKFRWTAYICLLCSQKRSICAHIYIWSKLTKSQPFYLSTHIHSLRWTAQD